jgi:hypothetical protein
VKPLTFTLVLWLVAGPLLIPRQAAAFEFKLFKRKGSQSDQRGQHRWGTGNLREEPSHAGKDRARVNQPPWRQVKRLSKKKAGRLAQEFLAELDVFLDDAKAQARYWAEHQQRQRQSAEPDRGASE